jgi:hypothetical protein
MRCGCGPEFALGLRGERNERSAAVLGGSIASDTRSFCGGFADRVHFCRQVRPRSSRRLNAASYCPSPTRNKPRTVATSCGDVDGICEIERGVRGPDGCQAQHQVPLVGNAGGRGYGRSHDVSCLEAKVEIQCWLDLFDSTRQGLMWRIAVEILDGLGQLRRIHEPLGEGRSRAKNKS